MNVLTLCGSLRARSSNRAILRAYARLLPPTARVTHYECVAMLPPFNPDLDHEPVPAAVAELRRRIALADVVVVSTPEYAHALPGAFKNALDWLVSDPAFFGKPVVVLHVARGSTWALDSLKEVLRTMSAEVLEQASILLPLGSNQIDEAWIAAQENLQVLLGQSAEALAGWIANKPGAAPAT